MIIEFENDYLANLYYKGEAGNKKYWFQPNIVKKYIKTVDLLESLRRMEDLYKYHSLNYEALSGNKQGIESVRITNKYRLEFIGRRTGGDKDSLTVCRIIEISNHYQ